MENDTNKLKGKWRTIALDCTPTDTNIADQAFLKIYKRINRGRPKIFWFNSPHRLSNHLRYFMPSSLADKPISERDFRRDVEPYDLSIVSLYETRRWESIGREIHNQANLPNETQCGQFDVEWIAACEATNPLPSMLSFVSWMEPHAQLARHVSFYFATETCVFACKKPTQIHLDHNGALHNEDGPAVVYSDGWGLFRWHGENVPSDLILKPKAVTFDRINALHETAFKDWAIDRYGADRYWKEMGAQVMQNDECGTLYEHITDNWNRVRQRLVRVVNSTREPDGTYKAYYIRVPDTTSTAREGIAWSFGMSADKYRPLVQT